jgi:hypothetical protein
MNLTNDPGPHVGKTLDSLERYVLDVEMGGPQSEQQSNAQLVDGPEGETEERQEDWLCERPKESLFVIKSR